MYMSAYLSSSKGSTRFHTAISREAPLRDFGENHHGVCRANVGDSRYKSRSGYLSAGSVIAFTEPTLNTQLKSIKKIYFIQRREYKNLYTRIITYFT
jgi:hypothetical protein